MPLSGNYNAESQKPKYAIPGGAVDKRYIYAAAPGWTQRRFKSADGSEFYDEVLETKTLYTDATRTTVVTTAINGTGVDYPSIGGAYAINLVGGGTGYTTGTGIATTGGSGTGLTVDITATVIRTGSIATVDTVGAADALRTAGTYTIGASDYTTELAGTGATFSVVVNGSGAATITVVSGGSGYVVDETITIPDAKLGGGGAAALTFDVATVATTGGTVSSVNIVNYGSGYTNGDTITISGGTTPATATIRV
jgi:hypothetical protein